VARALLLAAAWAGLLMVTVVGIARVSARSITPAVPAFAQRSGGLSR
jgi:hypothetical protein